MGSTDITVDQGGSGGSDAIQTDGWPMRRVAAEARRVLLEMASTRFGVPVDQLAVSDGVITVKADPSKRVTYGELIGGKRFNVTLTGNNIDATTGVAKVKPVQELKIVGQSPQRYDIPAKVDGSLKWAVDVKLPGMVHARNVKPPVAGAKLVSIDESSVRSLPGFVKVVSKGNYVAVVCEREEQAIKAARQLKVELAEAGDRAVPGVRRSVHVHARRDADVQRSKPSVVGNPDAALAGAAKVVEAEYDVPFQGHTAFGPAHAMADPSNGQMTIYSNDMKSYGMRNGVAEFLEMPRDHVRVVWMEGPQGYGRTAADDAGFEAAYLAKEIGRPVRVQWMRQRRDGVGHQGPGVRVQDARRPRRAGQPRRARLRRARRRLQPPRLQRARHGADRAADGHAARRRRRAGSAATPSDMYAIPNRRMADARRAACRSCGRRRCAPATCAIPNGPQVDVRRRVVHRRAGGGGEGRPGRVPPEAAHGEHRRRQRLQARALDRGASRRRRRRTAGTPRPSPKPRGTGDILTGRGIAYAFRSQTVVARDRRGRGESQDRPRLGEAARRARTTAGWSSTPRRCAARSRAACCTR